MPERPIIGISVYKEGTASTEAITTQIRKGATALCFASHASRNPADDIAQIDGLIVMGNDLDIDPSLYIHRYAENDPRRAVHPETCSELATPEGRARAAYETEMIRLALAKKMPLLGICAGMQRINVLLGGTLHQHVPDLVGHEKHAQRKNGIAPTEPVIPVLIEGGTLLAKIAASIPMAFTTSHSSDQPKVIHENSNHHQAIDQLAQGLRACAWSDGVLKAGGRQGYLIKAYEADPAGDYAAQCLIGIQWHPEFGASPLGDKLAEHFLQQAFRFHREQH